MLVAVPGAPTLSGRQAPNQPSTLPRTVQLTPAEAAAGRRGAQKRVGRDVARSGADALGARRLIIDPCPSSSTRAGTLYVDEHEPQQHAARHPRHRLGGDGPHVEDGAPICAPSTARCWRRRAAHRTRWMPDLNKDGSRDIRDMERAQGAGLPHPRHGRRRHRGRVADHRSKGSTRTRPSTSSAACSADGELIFGVPPGVWRLKDDNGDGMHRPADLRSARASAPIPPSAVTASPA